MFGVLGLNSPRALETHAQDIVDAVGEEGAREYFAGNYRLDEIAARQKAKKDALLAEYLLEKEAISTPTALAGIGGILAFGGGMGVGAHLSKEKRMEKLEEVLGGGAKKKKKALLEEYLLEKEAIGPLGLLALG